MFIKDNLDTNNLLGWLYFSEQIKKKLLLYTIFNLVQLEILHSLKNIAYRWVWRPEGVPKHDFRYGTFLICNCKFGLDREGSIGTIKGAHCFAFWKASVKKITTTLNELDKKREPPFYNNEYFLSVYKIKCCLSSDPLLLFYTVLLLTLLE